MLPELFLTGYNLMAGTKAEPRGGPSYAAAQAIAVDRGVSIVFTYPEAGNETAGDPPGSHCFGNLCAASLITSYSVLRVCAMLSQIRNSLS